MTTTIDKISQDLADVRSFVEDRYDPLSQNVEVMKEEQVRLNKAVEEILEAQRESNRLALLRTQEASPRFRYVSRAGEVRDIDATDLKILQACFANQLSRKSQLDQKARDGLDVWHQHLDVATRALDSTTAGSGDELVPTAEMAELWMDVNLMAAIKPLLRNVQMPTNPFDIPLQFGDVNWYRGVANTAATSTDPTTAKRTLTATEFVAVVAWAYELDEDAVVAMLPEIRATLVRNTAEVMDDVLLNGDTTDDGTNINNDGGSSGDLSGAAGLDQYLAFDGLIHVPLVDNTGNANNHSAAVSDDMFNEIRSKCGKYGVRPSECVFVTDINTYIRAQSISNFRTLDKLGPNATLFTGQLGDVEGVPVIVSEQMALADTDGKVTKGGNGTDTGRLLFFNRSQYYVGTRRDMTIEVERDVQKRQTVMVVSFRMAFEGRNTNSSDEAAALQYNITGVS